MTIAIPTYNRPTSLNERLVEVSTLPKRIAIQVELLICDNGDIQSPIPKRVGHLSVRYFKNERNLGLGGNINSCVKLSRGDFVWLCSDDDQIQIGNLSELLKKLSQSNSQVIALGDTTEQQSHIGQSTMTLELPPYWTDFGFIGGCIYKTEEAKHFIVNRSSGELNATYQQILIALGMYAHGSRIERLKNIYVVDTCTPKIYKVRAAYVARILDLIKLENQLNSLGLPTKDLVQICNKTDSHILNYLPRMSFEYTSKSDFLELLQLVVGSLVISKLYSKRFMLLLIGTVFIALCLLDFRLGRFSVKVFEFITRKRLVEFSYRDIWMKRYESRSSEASTLGYESE